MTIFDNEVTILDASTRPQDIGFTLWKRFDQETQEGTYIETKPNGDRVFEFTVPSGIGNLYIQGSGGGGGGGGGASGRGPEWPPGGGGAGGNGCACNAIFPLFAVVAGNRLRVVLGHEGAPGTNAIGTDQFGQQGGGGGDSIVYLSSSVVLIHFPGANPGSGGQFQRGGTVKPPWLGGEPGSSVPPASPTGYSFTSGGRGAREHSAAAGQTAQTPPGGAGGPAGTGSGGGGGGSSLLANGGNGGNYATFDAISYGTGGTGAFGSGGGGGAGGGPGTSDDGGKGGPGGLGYVWFYTRSA